MSRLIAATLVVGGIFAGAAQAHEVTVKASSPTSQGGVEAVVAYQFQPRGVLRPTGGESAVRQILTRIRTDADSLRRSVEPRGTFGTSRQSGNDDVAYLIDDLVQATDHLSDHLDRRQVIQVDVDDVMRHGEDLRSAIGDRTSSSQIRSAWSRLQTDLDGLASAYGMNWDWRNPSYAPIESAGGVYQRLTGTYQLDPSRSDDPRRIADQPIGQVAGAQRTAISRRIQNRLDSPEQLAIERVNGQVTMASSRAPRVSFDADGRPEVEPGFGSRNMTTRATIYGDRLEVVTNGDTDNDFTAIFEPLDNGQSLRVTKRLVASSLRQPIVVRSVYRRISETPDWNVYNGRAIGTSGRSPQYDQDVVPDGTTLVATLDEPLNVRTIQQNDRVALTVHNAPTAALENAVVEGYITSVPSQINGSGLSIAFNQIRLRNGRTSGFAGTVENGQRGPNGEPISFNGEDVGATDSNQRDQAIQRGAIGAAVGALIGAVAGGGKGAAIGAVLGGGGGAATVLLGGQRQADLPRGTEFTIRSRAVSR